MEIFQILFWSLTLTSSILAADVTLNCEDSINLADFSPNDEITILSHPNFGGSSRYENDVDCFYDIAVADDGIKVTCDFFRVEFEPNCYYDWLGFINDDDLSDFYCGSGIIEFSSSSTNPLLIWFHSDESVRRKGFNCVIQRGDSSSPAPPPPPPPPPPPSPPSPSSDCNCGQKYSRTRIVGGVETDVNEYPWQVGLVSPGSGRPFCGGSLLNREWVLTAAHCLGSNFDVILGEHDVNDSNESNTVRKDTISRIRHPDYNSGNLDYDYALVRLASPIDYSNTETLHIGPVCLPTRDPPVGSSAVITGWGTTSSGGSTSPVLLEANVNIRSNADCNNDYSGRITDRMICAAAPGKDSCQGDSGGPMVSLNGNNWEIVGVTSWGFGCAEDMYPGVYARVFESEILDWINDNIGSTAECPPRP